MTAKMMKVLLSVAFLGVGLLSMGCDERDWQHYYGGGDYGYTDVGVGFSFWPAWSDYTVVDEYQTVTPVYADTGYYDSGYYDDGFYGGDYYGDCPDCAYKAKLAGRTK